MSPRCLYAERLLACYGRSPHVRLWRLGCPWPEAAALIEDAVKAEGAEAFPSYQATLYQRPLWGMYDETGRVRRTGRACADPRKHAHLCPKQP